MLIEKRRSCDNTFTIQGVTEGFGQEVVVETRGNGALCGVRFTVGKSYILMGK